MKEEYISKITTQLSRCNDILLLDLIYQLLLTEGGDYSGKAIVLLRREFS